MKILAKLRIPIVISLLLVSTTLTCTNAKTQSSHLGKLYKAKYHNNGNRSPKTKLNHHHYHHHDHHNKQEELNLKLKESDRIKKLPGQPPVNFSQYGGYVTVDEKAGRAFYYYFVEADLVHNKQPHNSFPLLLWLNGGPGCSSLAYGAMQELGPFRVASDGKTLFRNKFAWNRAANVLFLESPAGVGFSYSNRTSDYETLGDRKTAEDNYVFLVNWLERFPEYKGRDFYISGESYAGHYVPQLAHLILQHNLKAKDGTNIINLKGIIIGNAVMNDETDMKGMYEYLWTHALVSDQIRNQIVRHCDFSANVIIQSTECNSAIEAADLDIQFLDIYNIYASVCLSSNLTVKPNKPSQVLDPCSDNYVYAYLNSPEVQKALHANVTKLDHDWRPCSDIITNWEDSPSTVLPLLKDFIDKGLRVWIFSGDTDGRIPVTSTRASINKMGLAIKTAWHPWFIKGEVGGYTQVYERNLTFATVRGAGHQVPSFQPLRALSLIKHFLDGTPLPNTSRSIYYNY